MHAFNLNACIYVNASIKIDAWKNRYTWEKQRAAKGHFTSECMQNACKMHAKCMQNACKMHAKCIHVNACI